jgi:SAM-dependent methyltransferase
MILTHYLQKKVVETQTKEIQKLLSDDSFSQSIAITPLFGEIGTMLNLKEGKKVLELGCGPGKFVALLSKLGFEVTGVDPYSFASWEIIKKYTTATLMDSIYAENLPFKNESFDYVVCASAFNYFKDQEKAVSEMKRLLKDKGKLFMRFINKDNFYTKRTNKPLDPASTKLHNMEEMSELLQKFNFNILDKKAHGFWPSYFTNFYFCINTIYFPNSLKDLLSNLTPPQNRIINTILCQKSN